MSSGWFGGGSTGLSRQQDQGAGGGGAAPTLDMYGNPMGVSAGTSALYQKAQQQQNGLGQNDSGANPGGGWSDYLSGIGQAASNAWNNFTGWASGDTGNYGSMGSATGGGDFGTSGTVYSPTPTGSQMQQSDAFSN